MTDTEDRLVERVEMEAEEKRWDDPVWVQNLRSTLDGSVTFAPEMREAMLRCFNEHYGQSVALLSAATTFIEECDRMGWGETSETALPGSFDLLRKAVDEVRG